MSKIYTAIYARGRVFAGPTADGTSGQAIVTDANGNLSFATVGGGVSSLNSLTGALTIAVGTSGPDVAVSASGSTVTVNIPDAGASARGVITTGAQTIAGAKTFSGTISSPYGGTGSEHFGATPVVSGSYSTSVGGTIYAAYGTANLGFACDNRYSYSIALGFQPATTAANQLMIGSAGGPINAMKLITDAIGGSLNFGVTSGNLTITPSGGQVAIQSVASHSSPIFVIREVSSTPANREQYSVDTAWIDSTDATRKARATLNAYDTASREFARGWGDGSTGRIAVAAPASAPTDAHLAASQISFYLDETGHNLLVRAKYANGTTLKLATIALV